VCRSCGVAGFLDRNGRCDVCGSDPAGEKLREIGAGVRDAVNRWRRSMAAKYHPDRNPGSGEIMIALNAAGDDILRLVERVLSERP
jgi:ribosomal protein L37E